MAVAQPYRFEMDLVRNPFSLSVAWFFVIDLKSILKPVFERKIHEKKFLDTKNFLKADIHKSTYI